MLTLIETKFHCLLQSLRPNCRKPFQQGLLMYLEVNQPIALEDLKTLKIYGSYFMSDMYPLDIKLIYYLIQCKLSLLKYVLGRTLWGFGASELGFGFVVLCTPTKEENVSQADSRFGYYPIGFLPAIWQRESIESLRKEKFSVCLTHFSWWKFFNIVLSFRFSRASAILLKEPGVISPVHPKLWILKFKIQTVNHFFISPLVFYKFFLKERSFSYLKYSSCHGTWSSLISSWFPGSSRKLWGNCTGPLISLLI